VTNVRHPSVRVRLAVMATAGAVVALILLSSSINTLLERTLVADVDVRLADRARAVIAEITEKGTNEPLVATVDPEFREPLLVWRFSAAGVAAPASDIGTPSLQLPKGGHLSPGILTEQIGGTRFRLRVDKAPGGGVIAVGASLASMDHTIGALHLVEVLIEPVLAAVVFVAAYLFAGTALHPVERLRSTAEQVGHGASQTRFRPEPPLDELGRLASTFDDMLDRLEQVRGRQDQLTADASHELRTPLAVIEAEGSLALRYERSTEEYRASLSLIVEEAQRMAAVVDEMLWLARADGGVTVSAAEPQDLGEAARQVARRFESIAEARGLKLECSAPDGPVLLAAPARWLQRLLDTLVDNACKYTPAGGTVRVAVAREEDEVLSLEVADSGPGIPDADRIRLRQRFQRGKGPASQGFGLGLAVADAVVRATQGRMDITSPPTGGTLVRVVWGN
jgi:two-component system OmpR family sensor kinase